MVELDLSEDFVIPFSIIEKYLSLLFMLEGEAFFCTDEDEHINAIRTNSFLSSIFNKGKFCLKAKAGYHALLLINMDSEWIEKKLKKLTPKLGHLAMLLRTNALKLINVIWSMKIKIVGYF